MSQQEMADRCGVTMRSQRNYEKGERSPDAEYLAALAVMGVNVLHILTGQSRQPVAPQATLSRRAQALMDNYEATDEAGKRYIERAADLEAQSVSKKAARGGE